MSKADKMVGGKKKSVAKVAWSVSIDRPDGSIVIEGNADDVHEAGLAATAARRAVEHATSAEQELEALPEPDDKSTRSRA